MDITSLLHSKSANNNVCPPERSFWVLYPDNIFLFQKTHHRKNKLHIKGKKTSKHYASRMKMIDLLHGIVPIANNSVLYI